MAKFYDWLINGHVKQMSLHFIKLPLFVYSYPFLILIFIAVTQLFQKNFAKRQPLTKYTLRLQTKSFTDPTNTQVTIQH